MVTAYIFDAQNFEVDRDVLEVDTASLAVATDVEGAPLGVVATVTDAAASPGRDVPSSGACCATAWSSTTARA